jgi:hypothetical protein
MVQNGAERTDALNFRVRLLRDAAETEEKR